jgi:hypothetical protein
LFPSMGKLEFLLFNGGAWALQLWGTVGNTSHLCNLRSRAPGSCKVGNFHSMEVLGFQSLDRGDQTLSQAGKVRSASVHFGETRLLVPPTGCQAAFLPSVRICNYALKCDSRGSSSFRQSGGQGIGPLCTMGGRHFGICRIADCHLLNYLGFSC